MVVEAGVDSDNAKLELPAELLDVIQKAFEQLESEDDPVSHIAWSCALPDIGVESFRLSFGLDDCFRPFQGCGQ